jgi:hypothetical protein
VARNTGNLAIDQTNSGVQEVDGRETAWILLSVLVVHHAHGVVHRRESAYLIGGVGMFDDNPAGS